jgi:endonuclease/exonuclease/phosphatase family metal-dependent hydrolase
VRDRLVVASYNIHGCVGSDGKRDVARVAGVIESLKADVIALQEVDWQSPGKGKPPQKDVLSRLADMHVIAAPTFAREHGHYGNALLTRLPVLAERRLDLTCPGREPRGALDVDLDAGSVRLRVVATHLGLLPGERRQQVKRILETVAADEDAITVLLGDINEWLMLGRPVRWLHARFGHCRSRATFPARFPLLALDRIWVHPSSAIVHFDAHDTRGARVASDHLPVRAVLHLDGATAR